MPEKNPLIRSLYLYLFSLVGLGMLIFGLAQAVNIVLADYVFRIPQDTYYSSYRYATKPPPIPAKVALLEASQPSRLSAADLELIAQLRRDQEAWQQSNDQVNRAWDEASQASNRLRDWSQIFSLLLVGWLIWGYHWSLIQRESRRV